MEKIIILLVLIMTTSLSVSCDINKQSTDKETVSKENTVVTTENISTKGNKNNVIDYLDKKILIVYFSASNFSDVDAVSSATANGDKEGATGVFAQYIQERVGGDIVKILPKEDYPGDYNHLLERAKKEKEAREYPQFTVDVNPEEYDIIFVGYPIWSYDMPRVMYTFFARYDFTGKTLIPFNTYGSSLDGGTYDKIRELEPDAIVADGLAIEGKSIDSSKEYVEQWVPEL